METASRAVLKNANIAIGQAIVATVSTATDSQVDSFQQSKEPHLGDQAALQQTIIQKVCVQVTQSLQAT